MGSFSDLVCEPLGVTKTIRGVSYPIILSTEYSLPSVIVSCEITHLVAISVSKGLKTFGDSKLRLIRVIKGDGLVGEFS